MNQDVIILVGTMGGTAELAAEDVAEDLRIAGHSAEVVRMEKAAGSIFDRNAIFLVCTSSCGHGEIPVNARPFFAELEQTRPDLSHVRYAVLALGDRKHHDDTFCFGGRKFDELLEALGAQRVVPRLQHDGSSGRSLEAEARSWVAELAGAITA